jgi:hypothetical protein
LEGSPDVQILKRQRLVLHAAVDFAEPSSLRSDVGRNTGCLSCAVDFAPDKFIMLITIRPKLFNRSGVVVESAGAVARCSGPADPHHYRRPPRVNY